MAKNRRVHRISSLSPILGLLFLGLVSLAIALYTHSLGNGWKQVAFASPAIFLLGSADTVKGTQIWLQEHRRKLIAIALQITFLIAGLSAIELYARGTQGYMLWNTPLEKANVFFELDKAKKWNRKFYESRKQYFREWPIPLELFEADKPEPRYLYKPNMVLNLDGGKTVIASSVTDKSFLWTNSWGFRGEEFAVQKAPGTIRIVFLGASTTEGSQTNKETYPYKLQQEMQKRYPNKAIEIINAGHHGQGIADLLEIFKQRVLPLKPDLVIFYEGNNDVVWGEFLKPDPDCSVGSCWLNTYPGWYRWLHERSATFVLMANWFGWNTRQPPPMNHQFVTEGVKSPLYYRKVLTQIVQEAKANNIPIILTSFATLAHPSLTLTASENLPRFDALYKQFYPLTAGEIEQIFEIFNHQSAAVAKEFNLPYIDIASKMPKDPKYFPFDLIHFSPEANQLLATIYADYLGKEYLPKKFQQMEGTKKADRSAIALPLAG